MLAPVDADSRRSGGRRKPAATPPAGSLGAPAALTLVSGPEDFLVSRAVHRVVNRALALDPQTERRYVAAEEPDAGNQLILAVSPSLFATAAVVVVSGAQDAAQATIERIASATTDLPPATHLVVLHGGQRNRKYLDILRAVKPVGGFVEVDCSTVKKGQPTVELLQGEASAQGRRLQKEAAEALIHSVGPDIGLLLGSLEQLLADDPQDPVTREAVESVMRGVAEVSGFQVSDAVWERHADLARQRLRWGLQTASISGPAAVGALAAGLRAMIRVGSAGSGLSDAEIAATAGVPAFKVRQLRAAARGWDRESLSRALVELADIDAATKGGLVAGQSLDPVQKNLALEQWVARTCGSSRAGRARS